MVNFVPKMAHASPDVHVTMIVLKETPVINQDAWKLVASIQIVKVPISIVILIIKYAMTNVRMMIIVVKDINVQELVNAWKPVKIIKIVITDNIVMKMKSIAKSIVFQIKIVSMVNFAPKMVHANPDVQLTMTVQTQNVAKINAWILVFKTRIAFILIIVWKNYVFHFASQIKIVSRMIKDQWVPVPMVDVFVLVFRIKIVKEIPTVTGKPCLAAPWPA